MRDRWLLPCVVVAACFMPVGVRGDEPRPSAAQIDRLIRQLGSEVFSEREEASRQLKKIGPAAMPALRAAIKSKDAEMSRRAADIAAVIENTLEQLVIDYRAFGLPLPPTDAKLVRVNGFNSGTVSQLAFQLKPATAKEGPVILQGTDQWQPSWVRETQEVDPKPETVKGLSLGGEGIGLAIQCYDRGWHKLAEHLLEQTQKIDHDPPRLQLLHAAWDYWEGKLTQPKIDRAPIARCLKELIDRDTELGSVSNRALLKSLDLALVPSKAKPGAFEALIDDLVDYAANTGTLGSYPREDRYWRIAELGFDAVPALIDHLDDDRLTRAMMKGFNNFPSWHLRVKHGVSDLLEELAGQDLGRDWLRRQQGYTVTKAAAKMWWDEARKVGEEAYLLKHVLPAPDAAEEDRRINTHQLHLILARYPKHVPDLYRTVLDKRPELDSGRLAEAVSRCKMPAQEKLDLFLYAAKHKDNDHRLPALRAIKGLDKKKFDALVIAAIEALPNDVPGPYWTCPEAHMAQLVIDTDDPRVWDLLAKVAKRSAVGLRMELLNHFVRWNETGHRPERLRLLAAFLDDTASRDTESSKKYDGPCAGFHYRKLSVQNFVADELASLLNIEVELKPDRTAEEWAKIRDQVRKAVDRELGQRK